MVMYTSTPFVILLLILSIWEILTMNFISLVLRHWPPNKKRRKQLAIRVIFGSKIYGCLGITLSYMTTS